MFLYGTWDIFIQEKKIIKTMWFKLWLDTPCSYTEHGKIEEELINKDYTNKSGLNFL